MAWQAGLLNVDAMRDGLTAEQVEEWHRAYSTGRLDDSWQQAAMIACELRNVPLRIAKRCLGAEIKDEEYATPDQFVPRYGKRKKRRSSSIREMQTRLAEKYG